MKHYYIATVEVTTENESEEEFEIIDKKDYEVIGIIRITEEHQKQKPSYDVSLRTQKKHARALYNDFIKPKPGVN